MSQQQKSTQNTLQWIADEQEIHETAGFGENLASVSHALHTQRKRDQLVQDYRSEAETAAANQQDEEKEKILDSYSSLVAVSSKRLCCLEDISQIAGLENQFGSLSVELAQRAAVLVTDQNKRRHEVPSKDGEGIAKCAQNCILAVRKNWSWMSKLLKCTDTHLNHVTEYHQFFHDLEEYGQWMPIQLRKAQDRVSYKLIVKGSKQETDLLLLDLKELLTLFLHWQGKLTDLFDRSKKVVPVQLRTHKLNYFRPISALCDYRTRDINIREGEELLLLDNSKPQSWLVRNMHAKESMVPSVICLIPGPDPAAIEAGVNICLELLGIWTSNVKRIGKVLIAFMLLVLREQDDSKTRALEAIQDPQKGELLRILRYIEDTLAPYWGGYDGFKALHGRMEVYRDVLTGRGKSSDRDDEFTETTLDRFKTTEDLLKTFQEFWKYWETYKILLETSRHADQILISDRWQQLKFIDTDELRRLWQRSMLEFSEEEQSEWQKFWERVLSASTSSSSITNSSLDFLDGSEGLTEAQLRMLNSSSSSSSGSGLRSGTAGYGESEFSEGMIEETITATTTSTVESSMVGGTTTHTAEEESVHTLESSRETTATDQLTKIEQEEKKTFVITGVLDPRNGEEVSMQKAVHLGIIDSNNGLYVNPSTKESMPIPTAMNMGKIKVEFTTTKRSAEKRQDVGLITITTERESRPYTVKGVTDVSTDEQLSVDEAVAKGILDQKNATYHNRLNDSYMSLAEALDSGLLIVEFDKETHVAEPEVVTRTYAIHSVVDQRSRNKVTFAEAVRLGLLDKATGAYRHNVNNEDIYVGEAIRRGFIKATVVADPNSLDIDPENKMVVQKVETIKKKLLNPLKAMAAMKKAANANGNN